jgi:hypothetical protein
MADEEEVIDGEQVERKKERVQRREIVTTCDATAQLTKDVIEFANQVMDEAPDGKQKDWSQALKATLDKNKGGTWHVIAGCHFGGNVTNDSGTLVNFKLDNTWFLVFRSGPPEKASDHAES